MVCSNSSRLYFNEQVDEKIKEIRKKNILLVQEKIVAEKNNDKVGIVYNSLVEGYDRDKNMYIVRPYFNARGIDDNVYIKTSEKLISGTFTVNLSPSLATLGSKSFSDFK